MGLNVDLTVMLSLPDEVVCPKCKATAPTGFDDCDIEDLDTNPKPSIWAFTMYCPLCDHEWEIAYRVAHECLGTFPIEFEPCTRSERCARPKDHPGSCCTSNIDTWESALEHEDWKRYDFGKYEGRYKAGG